MHIARTPAGDEMVVLPRADYEALIAAKEDATDRALLADALDQDRATPTMPSDLVSKLIVGELHPMAAWCEAIGFSQSELARRAGQRPSTVSDIIRGVVKPRYETVKALADALGLTVDDIM